MGQTFSTAYHDPGIAPAGVGQDFQKMEFALAETTRGGRFASLAERDPSGKTGQTRRRPSGSAASGAVPSVERARTGSTSASTESTSAAASTRQISGVRPGENRHEKSHRQRPERPPANPQNAGRGYIRSSEANSGPIRRSSRRIANRQKSAAIGLLNPRIRERRMGSRPIRNLEIARRKRAIDGDCVRFARNSERSGQRKFRPGRQSEGRYRRAGDGSRRTI